MLNNFVRGMAVLAGSAVAIAVVDAAQHPPSSLYTSIALDTCKPQASGGGAEKNTADAPAPGKEWLCAALMPVFAMRRDGRFYLAIGANPRAHRAARQTLDVPNSPVDPKSKRITIEWRIKTRAAGQRPYASIIRYFTKQDGRAAEVLVVAKIDDGQSCHVAYVDAGANEDAIVLARSAADETVPGFDCADGQPVWLGAR